jgi:TonB family protein
VGEQRFSLANGFNHAKLKQRITMMHKKQTPARVRFAYAAVLPVLAATMFVCNPARARIISSDNAAPVAAPAVTDQNPPAGETVPFGQVERKPTFNGGDANEFAKWVAQNIKYPESAKADGIEGRVMVQFKVCADGEVRDAKVLRSVNEALDAEAVRVISASPKWEPGIQGGKAVDVIFSFPVIFKLNGEAETINTFSVKGNIIIRDAEGGLSNPLIYLDGVKYTGTISDIDPATIASMEILKDQKAIDKYGEEAKNGVILITSKKQ